MPRLPQNLPPSIQGDSQPRPEHGLIFDVGGLDAVVRGQAESLDPLPAAARRRPSRRSCPRRRRRAARARRYRHPSGATPADSGLPAPAVRWASARRLGAQPHHLQPRRGVRRRRRRLIDRHQHLRRPLGHADQRRGIAAVHPAVVAEGADAAPPPAVRRVRAAARCAPPAVPTARSPPASPAPETRRTARCPVSSDGRRPSVRRRGSVLRSRGRRPAPLGSANGSCGFGHSGVSLFLVAVGCDWTAQATN